MRYIGIWAPLFQSLNLLSHHFVLYDYTEHHSSANRSQQVNTNQIDVYQFSAHCYFCWIVHASVGRFAPCWHEPRGQAITQSTKLAIRSSNTAERYQVATRVAASLSFVISFLTKPGLISIAKVERSAVFVDGDFCFWLIAQWEAKIRQGRWVIFQPRYCLCAGHDRYRCQGQARKVSLPLLGQIGQR